MYGVAGPQGDIILITKFCSSSFGCSCLSYSLFSVVLYGRLKTFFLTYLNRHTSVPYDSGTTPSIVNLRLSVFWRSMSFPSPLRVSTFAHLSLRYTAPSSSLLWEFKGGSRVYLFADRRGWDRLLASEQGISIVVPRRSKSLPSQWYGFCLLYSWLT